METGVGPGVADFGESASEVAQSLKPHLEAVLPCFECEGVGGAATGPQVFRADGTPTLFSDIKVRKARTHSSEASRAS